MAIAPFSTSDIASTYVPRIQRVLMIAEATAAATSSPLDAKTIRRTGRSNRPKWIALGLCAVAATALTIVLATGGGGPEAPPAAVPKPLGTPLARPTPAV